MFTGFAPAAFDFYERLEADNSRAFWAVNKATYETEVRAPMAALCERLAEFGPFHLFRPQQDLRFVKNRPPYKIHQGAVSESEGGTTYYVHLSAEGMMAGAGYYHMAKDQLERFRAAVDDAVTGAEVEALVAAVERRGSAVSARDALKTAPRGYARDHPRVALLRRGGLVATRSWPVGDWMHTPKVVAKIRAEWEQCASLGAWLDRHVGPSTLPPPEFGRP
jgi:uncharacterized protein (TIGR02453 family)